uniref:Abcf-2 n=1 Tax=Pristionchus pacificus TaxID=54126 RepID=A0A2A6BW43_PRIPA|eukprot:PDM70124.1 abcf-2 [Pristionchus pacificus]
MPSDAKKARDAAKKNATKSRGKARDTKAKVDEEDGVGTPVNELENGVESVASENVDDVVDAAAELLKRIELENAQARSVAGALASNPRSMDVKVESLTVTFHGREIVVDTTLEINMGRRYGLIGLNGSGKSTLLQAIYNRELPLPDHVDMYMVSREMPASNMTALQAVVDVDKSQEKLMDIYERLDEMDADKAEMKAANLLHGLGFTKTMQMKQCKDFSGGWRMRIALARALYLKPSLLLLDEPTNHLDLEACVWLEEELKNYKRALMIVSHSQDFMNGVCTNVIHLFQKKLVYYGGNYDSFVKTRLELLENQMKRYKWEQDQLQHMKDYVARFGHGSAKLARQAQSKEKTMAKMIAGGLTEKAVDETVKQFYFFDAGEIPPPVIMVQHVSFRYNETTPWIYRNLDFGIDLDTRLALVGPNGAGKSTLLKLLCSDVMPTDGLIRRHSHVKIGRYHQFSHFILFLLLHRSMTVMGSDSSEPTKEEDLNNNDKKSLPDVAISAPSPDLSTGKELVSSATSVASTQPASDDSGLPPYITPKLIGSSSDINSARVEAKVRATVVQFCPVSSKPDVARVQLVLCNISERPLQFNIKCVGGNSVTAFPTGNGDIDARGQSRLTLTWHRPPEFAAWSDTPNPKMLLVIKFQGRKGEDSSPTTIRLLGKINMKFCKPDKPPEEQLLLDADTSEVATVSNLRQRRQANAPASHIFLKNSTLSPSWKQQFLCSEYARLDCICTLCLLDCILHECSYKHLHEELPLEISALDFMLQSFPEVKEKEAMRRIVGRYGITGREQVCPMKQLSDGQRCRVSFAWLAWQQPHLLLLDEPTNHLDMESIDALAEAINCYSGGMILVSHDFRLVSQVADVIWVCDKGQVTKWEGDIFSYKDHLRKEIEKETKDAVRER